MTDSTLSIVLMVLSILTVIMGVYFVQKLIIKNRRQRENAKMELNDNLLNAFLEGHISSPDDLKNLIEGFPLYNRLYIRLPWDLLTITQQLKYRLATSKEFAGKWQPQKLDDLINLTNQLLDEEKIKAPFESAPPIEKNLLLDILELSGQRDNLIFRDKLNRLSDQIITRQSTIEKLSVDSAKSFKTSKLSFIWGIIFFIVSLVLSLYSLLK